MHRENWDDLRYVLAVAETGSVSGAARALGVNHATVLRHVAGFEERHGVEIFDKSVRGYAVSVERVRLLDAAREVEAAHSALALLIRGLHAPLRGVIRVTSTDSLCAALLPAVLAGLDGRQGELRFELLSSNLPVDLGRLHADLTVRPAERLGDDLRGVQAARMGFAVFRRRGRCDEGWIGPTGVLLRSVAGAWLAENLADKAVLAAADSFVTLAAMAAQGLGQTLLPCLLGDADPRLERVEGAAPSLSVPIWVAHHADLEGVPRLAAARALLAGAIAAEAPRLAGEISGP